MSVDGLRKLWPNWKIEEEIGRGSFGVVYKAVNIMTDSQGNALARSEAAIKMIRISASVLGASMRDEGIVGDDTRIYLETEKDRCISEIITLTKLKEYPNIVPIEDFGEIRLEDEFGWEIVIRMQLLVSFDYLLEQRKGILDEKTVIHIGKDIARALVACEKEGILHRDVKQANIFYDEKIDTFKLGDFGISRELEIARGHLTNRGTPNYAAPEAFFRADYDARADQYSLGMVLYRLLNRNRPPFAQMDKDRKNDNTMECNNRRLRGDPLPPPCDASPAMRDVILRACDPDPNKRFPDANALLKAIIQVENGTYKIKSVKDEKTDKLKSQQRSPVQNPDGTTKLRKPTASTMANDYPGNGPQTPRPGYIDNAWQPGGFVGQNNNMQEPDWQHYQDRDRGRNQKKNTGGAKTAVVILIVIAAVVLCGVGGYFAYRHFGNPQPKDETYGSGSTPAISEDSLEACYITVKPLSSDPGVPLYDTPDTSSVYWVVNKNLDEYMVLDAYSPEGGWGHTSYMGNPGYVELNAVVIADGSIQTEQPLDSERSQSETRYIVSDTGGKTIGLHVSPDKYTFCVDSLTEGQQIMVMGSRVIENIEWAYGQHIESGILGWIPMKYLR